MPAKRVIVTDEEIAEARHRREIQLASQPLATAIRYDELEDTVVVTMNDGASLAIPRLFMQGLSQATPAQLRRGAVVARGTCLEWRNLDADFKITLLLNGIYGSPKWMAEVRKAVSRASSVKAAATRRSGAKGSRQRKTVA